MFSTIDMATLERVLVGGALGALAVVVAFGPELRHLLVRIRARGRLAETVLAGERATLRVESRAS